LSYHSDFEVLGGIVRIFETIKSKSPLLPLLKKGECADEDITLFEKEGLGEILDLSPRFLIANHKIPIDA
jgi:hypothetical protein